MQFSNEVLIRLAIALLGILGFFVAKHIRSHKTQNTPLVCPIGFDCHAVVHSDYSKFFGVPVEILGMIYYSSVSLFYLALVFIPEILPQTLIVLPMILSFAAFLFSIYLIAVQVFVLKKGCSWCIVSAFISAFIFILTTSAYEFNALAQIFIN